MKKVTRTIETVEYSVTFFDSDTEEISKGTYTDTESIAEKDIKRFLNNMLSDYGDSRTVVKIVPVASSVNLYAMPYDIFLKYATKVDKPGVDCDE